MAFLNTAAAHAAILAAKDVMNPSDKVTWAELSAILRSITDDIDPFRTIESNYLSSAGSYSNPSWLTSLAWSKLSGTPTTIGGYGITGGTLTGTAGLGFVGFGSQSSAPTTPTSGFRLYANSANALSWIGSNGFTRTFDGTTNTANRTYTLPDASGTFPLLGSNQTFSGANTFSGSLIVSGGTTPYTISQSTSLLNIVNSAGTATVEITGSGFGLSTNRSEFSLASTSGRFFFFNSSILSAFRISHEAGDTYLDSQRNNAIRLRTNTGASTVEIWRGFTTGNFAIGGTTDTGSRLQVTGSGTFSTLLGVGVTSINASAALQVDSTTRGFLMPRMTTAQRTAIASPANGLMVFDTDLGDVCYYEAATTSWKKISSSNA